MSDKTRDADLRELYEARENASTADRERLDEIRHKIINTDDDIVEARQNLVKAVRGSDAKQVRRISEEIKVMGYKKGTDKNGGCSIQNKNRISTD